MAVNHIATVPKQDWEMTTLQVLGKNKVPANAAKCLDTSEYGKLVAYLWISLAYFIIHICLYL